jgi:hypothetical protein
MNKWQDYRTYLRPLPKIILLWAIIGLIVFIGIKLGIDKKIIGVAVAVFGFLTNAFTGLLTLIALVPIIGPLIIKVISLPIFWIINGIGYILSVVAVKAGYAKEILNYRLLTIVFLLGIVVGFILGSVL